MTTWRVALEAATPSQADYPGLRALVLIDKTTTRKRDGRHTSEQRAYATSLAPGEKTPACLLALIRGHWGGVEIRNHWRRDAVLGEDGSRSRNVTLLANLALIRNTLLRVLADELAVQSLPVLLERLHSHPGRGLALLARA